MFEDMEGSLKEGRDCPSPAWLGLALSGQRDGGIKGGESPKAAGSRLMPRKLLEGEDGYRPGEAQETQTALPRVLGDVAGLPNSQSSDLAGGQPGATQSASRADVSHSKRKPQASRVARPLRGWRSLPSGQPGQRGASPKCRATRATGVLAMSRQRFMVLMRTRISGHTQTMRRSVWSANQICVAGER